MQNVFEAKNLTKRFNGRKALDDINLSLDGPGIIGLLGRNGCGKTTLIRHITGLCLPNEGQVFSLGRPTDELGHDELVDIGFVPQEVQLLDWMTVQQHLEYVACFYPSWDAERQSQLLDRLELDPADLVGNLSSGNLQKLAIILAVCHHPRFLVLDEPVSDLDPIIRSKLLQFLLEILREDHATILISSHVLRDVERIVDHVVCLEEGKVVTNTSLDELKESYSEWFVQAEEKALPAAFSEAFVLDQDVSDSQARLVVRNGADHLEAFCRTYTAEVRSRPLNLEEMFPYIIQSSGT